MLYVVGYPKVICRTSPGGAFVLGAFFVRTWVGSRCGAMGVVSSLASAVR